MNSISNIPLFDLPCIPNRNATEPPTSYSFYSSDTQDLFKQSSKKMGNNWKYSSEQILYKFNRYGYRSPDIDSIVDENYFIVYGCSHTEGIGIKEEDRYSNILSSRLGMKYLNFGQGGSSQNFLWMNNILGIKNLKIKPKFVVCQWPEISRLTIFDTFKPYELLTSSSINFTPYKNHIKLWEAYILTPEFYKGQLQGYFHSINQMWSSVNVKVIHFTLDQETTETIGIQKFSIDYKDPYILARDLNHPGAKLNEQFADYIESELKYVGV